MSGTGYYLEVAEGPRRGTRFRLLGGAVLIGRDDGCDIVFADAKGLSRRHARIEASERGVRVADLESRSGTFVNDDPVGTAALRPGDRLRVGPVTLRLGAAEPAHGEATPSSGPAAPARRAPARPGRPKTAAQPAPSRERPEPEADPVSADRGGRRALLRLGALLLVLLAIAYAAVRLGRPLPEAGEDTRILRIREERVFASVWPFARIRVVARGGGGIRSVEAARYGGPLAPVCEAASERLRDAGRSGFDFVVVRGRARGESEVCLLDSAGHEVRRVLAVVRGVRPYEWSRDMAPAAARRLAAQRLEEGRRLAGDGRLYGALVRYREARELFEEYGAEDPRQLEALRMELAPLEAELWQAVRDRLVHALALAYPAAAEVRAPRHAAASAVLEDLKRLLPDPESVERQIVDLWQVRIDLEAGRMGR